MVTMKVRGKVKVLVPSVALRSGKVLDHQEGLGLRA